MARPVAFLDETLAAQIALTWLVPCEVRRRAQMAAHAHRQRAIHEANRERASFHAGPWISSSPKQKPTSEAVVSTVNASQKRRIRSVTGPAPCVFN
jgi:hypothetical protein